MIVRIGECNRHILSNPEAYGPAIVKVSTTSHHAPERVEVRGKHRSGNCRQVTIKLTDRLRNLMQSHCGRCDKPCNDHFSLIFLAPLQDFLAGLNIAHRGIEGLRDGCDGQIPVPQFSGGVYSIHDTGVHLFQLLDCKT